MSIRVAVAEDFPLMRKAITECLATNPEMEVVGEATDGIEALQLAHEKRPDVLVLDLGMPRLGGMEALVRLRDELPDVRVLVVTASEKRENLAKALGAGAAGYMTKRSSMDELCEAVLSVSRGEGAISSSLTVLLIDALSEGQRGGGPVFRPRELDVLRLVADGLTDDEIAAQLSISARTVQAHLAAVRNKTGVRRRAELARWASENNLV